VTPGRLVDGGAIRTKDRVIVRGAWVYDAGHQGWNEIHGVRIVLRVDAMPSDPTEFKALVGSGLKLAMRTRWDGMECQGLCV